jgi:hypothetical protein
MALDLRGNHKLGDVGIPWVDYLGVDEIIKAAVAALIVVLGGIRFLIIWPTFHSARTCCFLPCSRIVRAAASARLAGARVIIAVELPSLDECLKRPFPR